jgi:hypothetical protein
MGRWLCGARWFTLSSSDWRRGGDVEGGYGAPPGAARCFSRSLVSRAMELDKSLTTRATLACLARATWYDRGIPTVLSRGVLVPAQRPTGGHLSDGRS